MKTLVYGCGQFFKSNEEHIKKQFEIVGFIDRNSNNTDNKVYRSYIEYEGDYERILIMIEKTDSLFEVINLLRFQDVNMKTIILGIGLYGKFSEYLDSYIANDNGIKFIIDGISEIVYDSDQFDSVVRTKLIPKLEKKGNDLISDIGCLYKKIYEFYWSSLKTPYSYNLECELYYRLREYGSFGFGTIAVFNLRAIHQFEKPYVLDLGCADGFYYNYYYSKIKGLEYVGCDIDTYAIAKAQNLLSTDTSAKFVVSDMIINMPKPEGKSYFTNIFWNESIQMFDEKQQCDILIAIKNRLGGKGILAGTAHLKDKSKEDWLYSRNAALDIEQIERLLKRFFKNVFVYNDRGLKQMIVFMASDSKIPFLCTGNKY